MTGAVTCPRCGGPIRLHDCPGRGTEAWCRWCGSYVPAPSYQAKLEPLPPHVAIPDDPYAPPEAA